MKAGAIALASILAGVPAGTSPARASPAFQLALEDGSGWVVPGDMSGRPSVLLFWDSRCPPCLLELTNLAALQKQYPEAVFVVVSLSLRDESRRILAQAGLPKTVMRARAPSNPQGLLASLGNTLGALPFAAAFAANGRRCDTVSGTLSSHNLTAMRARCMDNPGD